METGDGSVRRSPLKGNFPDMFKPAASDLTLLPVFLYSYQILLCFFVFFKTSTHLKPSSWLLRTKRSPQTPDVRRSARTNALEPAGLQIWAENSWTDQRVCPETEVMKRRSRGGAVLAERKKGNHRSIPPNRQRRVSVLPPRASQPE